MIPNFECAPHIQLMIDKIELLLRAKIKKLMLILHRVSPAQH